MFYHRSTTHAHQRIQAAAFTLVELMVSMTILVILMLVISNFIGLVQRTWVRTNTTVSQFREARIAFDIMTRNISQATLNSYWQTKRVELGKSLTQTIYTSAGFTRTSELQFVSGPTAGNSSGALFASASNSTYPGHGVFFQAPLGITSLVATTESAEIANTQNMVNLLCGRGYFVAWGDDEAFRPSWLTQKGVPSRFRLRLMEFSPTAEKNRIYDASLRPLINPDTGLPNTNFSKKWFLEAANSKGDNTSAISQTSSSNTENESSRAFTRPVAENILALIISPQMPSVGQAAIKPYRIAPEYSYDSLLIQSPGAQVTGDDQSGFGPQGTQHVLPPVLNVTMVALDARGGERLSNEAEKALREKMISKVTTRFTSVAKYDEDLIALKKDLQEARLAYRVFTTSIPLTAARWSR